MDNKHKNSSGHWNNNISGSGRFFLKKESNGSRPSSFSSADLDYLVDMCSDVDELELTPRLSPSISQLQSAIIADEPHVAKSNVGHNLLQFQRETSDSLQSASPERVIIPRISSLHHTSSKLTSPASIEVNVVRVGNKVHMVPVSDEDNALLMNIALNPTVQKTDISVSIVKESAPVAPPERTPTTSSVPKNTNLSVSHNPKHIYKTSCDTYRVQMSKGSKANPNGKFSRNARHELDAFWLCEFALIMMDRPTDFNDLLKNGNFKCMLERGMVSNPHDYAQQLKSQFTRLCHLNLLKPAEATHIVDTLRQYLPGLFDANTERDLINNDRPKSRSLLSTMTKQGSFSEMDHKKRRKSPHSLSDLTTQYVLEKRNSRKDVFAADTVASAVV